MCVYNLNHINVIFAQQNILSFNYWYIMSLPLRNRLACNRLRNTKQTNRRHINMFQDINSETSQTIHWPYMSKRSENFDVQVTIHSGRIWLFEGLDRTLINRSNAPDLHSWILPFKSAPDNVKSEHNKIWFVRNITGKLLQTPHDVQLYWIRLIPIIAPSFCSVVQIRCYSLF